MNFDRSSVQRFRSHTANMRKRAIWHEAPAKSFDVTIAGVLARLQDNDSEFTCHRLLRVEEDRSNDRPYQDASYISRNRIDPMVNLFRRSESKFVAAYRSARVVVDRPATHAPSKPPTPPAS